MGEIGKNGGLRGVQGIGSGGFGVVEELGGCKGPDGRSTRKPQVSIKSQTGVKAKKLKKGGKWGG